MKKRKKRAAIWFNHDDPIYHAIKKAATKNNRKIIDELRERFKTI